MSTNEAEFPSPVHRRGLITKSAFVVLVLAPCLAVSAAVLRFCIVAHESLLIAAGVMVLCLLLMDHFAYHAFCLVAVKPDGLLYLGGGLFWRKLRKYRLMAWTDYVYTVVVGRRGYYVGLRVTNKRGCRALHLLGRARAYDEFRAFVCEILINNPDARVQRVRRARRRSRETVLVKKDSIQIVGDRQFIARTTDALELIERHDPVNYRRIQKYLKTIESVEHPPATHLETRTFAVSKQIALGGDARWYGSTIVHEMCHCMLHHRFRFSWYNPRNQKKHEQICSKIQVRSLRRMGRSEEHLQYLETAFRRRLLELYGDA